MTFNTEESLHALIDLMGRYADVSEKLARATDDLRSYKALHESAERDKGRARDLLRRAYPLHGRDDLNREVRDYLEL